MRALAWSCRCAGVVAAENLDPDPGAAAPTLITPSTAMSHQWSIYGVDSCDRRLSGLLAGCFSRRSRHLLRLCGGRGAGRRPPGGVGGHRRGQCDLAATTTWRRRWLDMRTTFWRRGSEAAFVTAARATSDFDFLIGSWRLEHHRLLAPWAAAVNGWSSMDSGRE